MKLLALLLITLSTSFSFAVDPVDPTYSVYVSALECEKKEGALTLVTLQSEVYDPTRRDFKRQPIVLPKKNKRGTLTTVLNILHKDQMNIYSTFVTSEGKTTYAKLTVPITDSGRSQSGDCQEDADIGSITIKTSFGTKLTPSH